MIDRSTLTIAVDASRRAAYLAALPDAPAATQWEIPFIARFMERVTVPFRVGSTVSDMTAQRSARGVVRIDSGQLVVEFRETTARELSIATSLMLAGEDIRRLEGNGGES